MVVFDFHLYDLQKLISWENDLSNYEERSVAATFVSQLEDLDQRLPNVSNLLKILSFFDAERIPMSILIRGAEALSQLLNTSDAPSTQHSPTTQSTPLPTRAIKSPRQITGSDRKRMDASNVSSIESPALKPLLALIQSPVQLQNTIAQLQSRSLIKHSIELSVLQIHDLIKFMIQESIKKGGTEQKWFDIAVDLTSAAFQLVEDPSSHNCWAQCEIFIPHFQLLTLQDEIYGTRKISLVKANMKIAQYLESCGRYSEAETRLDQVLVANKRQLGMENQIILSAMHILAIVYQAQRRHSEAETLLVQVLASNKKLLGLQHLSTLSTMHNLARVYQSQGKYMEAETLLGEVLAGSKDWLGVEHPDTLATMNNLASVYQSQGFHTKAETLFQQVLEGRKKQLGTEHPKTLYTMNNLATLYRQQGQFREAEALLKKVVAGHKKQLGMEHPYTLRTMRNLAIVYKSQGQFSEAEALLAGN